MRRSKQPPSDIPVQETLSRAIPTTLPTKEEPSLQLPEPAETAFLAALSVIAAIAAVKRKR